jgi:hypothetical protein
MLVFEVSSEDDGIPISEHMLYLRIVKTNSLCCFRRENERLWTHPYHYVILNKGIKIMYGPLANQKIFRWNRKFHFGEPLDVRLS